MSSCIESHEHLPDLAHMAALKLLSSFDMKCWVLSQASEMHRALLLEVGSPVSQLTSSKVREERTCLTCSMLHVTDVQILQ